MPPVNNKTERTIKIIFLVFLLIILNLKNSILEIEFLIILLLDTQHQHILWVFAFYIFCRMREFLTLQLKK